MRPWSYDVRVYSNIHHSCGRFGTLISGTVHKTESSKDVEVQAALNRHDVSYVEVVNLETGSIEKLYNEIKKGLN